MPTTEGLRRLALGAAGCLLLASCAHGSDDPSASPAPSVSTLTPLELPPEPPPTGELVADLRQSSRDAALGRIQVWIDNDTVDDLTPSLITYRDPRFRASVRGQRLRPVPSGTERGYPLTLPSRPVCPGPEMATPSLRVTYGARTVVLPVRDPNEVVRRHVAARCLERAVGAVAQIEFADEVGTDGSGTGAVGTLVLVVRPSGVPGHVLRIKTVAGTPLLSAAGRPLWRPGVRVRSDGEVRRIELPVLPARCDAHAFMEAAGATAFRVRLRLDGRPGELVVRMGPAGASAAIAFARDSCGLGGLGG